MTFLGKNLNRQMPCEPRTLRIFDYPKNTSFIVTI
jgi:hypothetical protein